VLVLAPLTIAFIIIRIAMLVVVIFALVDGAMRPAQAYTLAGKWSKQGWMIVLGVGALVVFLLGSGLLGIAALIAAIVYLVDVRPAVKDFRNQGGSNTHMGPYGPW
jgi:hypothetical protein